VTVHTSELQSAIAAVKLGAGERIDPSLATGFLERLGDKKERMKFGEALRLSLNESFIRDKSKRQLYARLAGTFYGRRGNAAKRSKVARTPTPQMTPPVTPEFVEQPNGQRAFVI
jgi:hypothetical protein